MNGLQRKEADARVVLKEASVSQRFHEATRGCFLGFGGMMRGRCAWGQRMSSSDEGGAREGVAELG